MNLEEIRAIFDRIPTWSEDQQQLALELLKWVESPDDDAEDLTPEDWADLAEAEAEADRGEFASEEEIQAMFDRYRICKST
jgi:hypothetical protein